MPITIKSHKFTKLAEKSEKKNDFPTMKLDQIWRLLGTHGTTECNGKYKHISVIRKNMIAVYYNGITLRKKLS